jgi:hypothetical protein
MDDRASGTPKGAGANLSLGAGPTMIDRHYGHLAPNRREYAIRLVDEFSARQRPRWTLVDVTWTPKAATHANRDNRTQG